jgi:excisionase family DNA binding protein
MTTGEVARLFKTHPATIRRLCVRGEIRGIRLGGEWRIPADEVRRLLGTPVQSDAVISR